MRGGGRICKRKEVIAGLCGVYECIQHYFSALHWECRMKERE